MFSMCNMPAQCSDVQTLKPWSMHLYERISCSDLVSGTVHVGKTPCGCATVTELLIWGQKLLTWALNSCGDIVCPRTFIWNCKKANYYSLNCLAIKFHVKSWSMLNSALVESWNDSNPLQAFCVNFEWTMQFVIPIVGCYKFIQRGNYSNPGIATTLRMEIWLWF